MHYRLFRSRQHGFLLSLLLLGVILLLLAAIGAGVYAFSLDGEVREKFEGKRWALPAKVYSRPMELYVGAALGLSDVRSELDILHYREQAGAGSPGTWSLSNGSLLVHSRGFDFADRSEPSQTLRLRFQGSVLAELESTLPQQSKSGVVRLEPLTIGSIYPKQNEDRVLMQLKEAPPFLVDALIATEDREFYSHHGISPRGVMRAVWVNLTHGKLRQGGSTLTQQLVKNFYLNDERTLKRKLNEAAMAILLEMHYSKQEILETYLNEVNLGQAGPHSVNGFALASQYYFGQPIGELELQQVALLVGMVKGPSLYDPRRHPREAVARRNTVIDNLYNVGRITLAQRDAAEAKPLGVISNPTATGTLYPAFLDVVRRQLHKEYKEEDLSSEGLRIYTTLDPRVQNAASASMTESVERLTRTYGRRAAGIEGAMLVSNPENGELLAVIGGTQTRFTGFNRAIDISRQVGSLFKPAVYLTALESGKYNLATPLDDSAVQVSNPGGKTWEPENYDGVSHGSVPLYDALAHSYNQATVRLGMSVGVPPVLSTLKRLGVSSDLPPYPSVFLGAATLSPMEVMGMYQTIAANGFQSPLRSIRAVVDAHGKLLSRYELEVKQVFDPTPVYLLQFALQQTMRSGTGAAAYERLPHELIMAGKTGTTNDMRDSWFAGFTGNYLAVVWLGYDDNRPTGLTGAMGALPVWVGTMARLHPSSLTPTQPENVMWQWVDHDSGKLSSEKCSGALYVPFRNDTLPTESVACAQGTVPAMLDRMINKVKEFLAPR